MNKLTKKILAAMAAAVMTVSAVPAVSPSVYANPAYDTIADGWVKDGKTERRYMNGLPYTGWLNVEDGTKKYCLDGYLVTGSFTIDGKTYSFGKDGVLTGKGTVPAFSAECGEVNSDASMIDLTVYANKNDGKEYDIGDPEKMERWVKGKWTDCIGKNTEYAVDDIDECFSYDNSGNVRFFPQRYTNNNFKEGYYRITLSAKESGNKKASAKKFYTVFMVTPKNRYKDGWVTEGSMERRYKKDVPYTGWLDMKNGTRKYCLDGYLVKGELQMYDVIYTFNDEGVCTGKTNAVIYANCGAHGKVSLGTEKIMDINIYPMNTGDTYTIASPVRISRWEFGRWSVCSANGLPVGYYKADMSARSTQTDILRNVSTVFEVVSYEAVKNGWIKEGSLERRYKNDSPYTGWVNNKNGTRKYCFDGYAVTGDFQIGKYIYSFGSDGTYTGFRRKLVITASCGEVIASDTKTLVITVKNTGLDGRDYKLGNPYKMEKWENGRWVNCAGDGIYYPVSADAYTVFAKSDSKRSSSAVMSFYPQTYTGGSFTPGYYRIVLSAWDAGGSAIAWQPSNQDVYAMFEVV